MEWIDVASITVSGVSLGITALLGIWAIRLGWQQSEMINRLDELQAALAEVQLREKITVIRQRAERFRQPLKSESEKYTTDEAVTLIGDCDAALPLFAYAGTDTRKSYIDAVCEAANSIAVGHVQDYSLHLKSLRECLSKHINELQMDSQVEAARQLSACVDLVPLHLVP